MTDISEKRLHPREAFHYYLSGSYKDIVFLGSNDDHNEFLFAADDHEYSFRLEEESCFYVYSKIKGSEEWNRIDFIDNELIILKNIKTYP